jgi:hypothetical protein
MSWPFSVYAAEQRRSWRRSRRAWGHGMDSVLEHLHDAACLMLATNDPSTQIAHPAEDLSFQRFVAELQGNAFRFVQSKR